MKWSKEQLQAITEEGKNILVNAGAGSGKTAVLTTRLLTKVKNGIKLDSLIVLTFTKLAASEMKERLRSSLIKDGSEEAKNELEYIDQANIQTFDSFTNEIVRKYHYELNIPSKINIVDSVNFKMVSLDIIKEIFKKLYDEQNQHFFNMLNMYTVKDDKKIIDYLLKIYEKIRLDKHYPDIFKNPDAITNNEIVNEQIRDYEALLEKEKELLGLYLKKMERYTADMKLQNHYNEIVTNKCFNEKMSSYDDYLILKNIALPNMPSKVDDEIEKAMYSSYYGKFREILKKFKETYLIYNSSEEIAQNIQNINNNIKIILQILGQLDEELKKYKKKNNCYDFTDISEMAISLLEKNDNIRRDLSLRTKEILIDEYQDTSDAQEKLINLIARNNVYMVGDVKQSIYSFRNANPQIFKETYLKLKDSNDGLVIDLANNFRSREEVLETVNSLFKKIMTYDIGGAEYNTSQALNFGFLDYNSYKEDDYKTILHTYDAKDEDYQEYSKVEIEAFIIGRDIKAKVGKKKVYDKEKNTYRLSKYSDYAVLTSAKDNFEAYKKIFEYLGIPLEIFKDETFIKNDEIYVLINILKTVYSFYDYEYGKENLKASLTSFLRSFVCEIDDKTISKIIASGNIKKAFEEFLPAIYNIINEISKMILFSTVKEIILEIYNRFSIMEKINVLYNVDMVEFRMNYYQTIVQNLVDLNYTFKDIIDYFDLLVTDEKSFEIKVSNKKSSGIEAVKMMSIHASKGLEFPICYFPEMYRSFNFSDLNDLIIYSKKYKIIAPYFENNLLKTNICKILESKSYHEEAVGERIRLLYVALTRPREQIIIVSPMFDGDKERDELTDNIKSNFKTYYEFLDAIYLSLVNCEQNILLKDLALSKEYNKNKIIKDLENETNKKLFFNDFKLIKEEIGQRKASKSKVNYISKEELESMEIGTKFHKILELVDFNNVNLGLFNLNEDVEKLLRRFFESKFIKEKKIIKTYHEYAFCYEEENEVIKGIIDLIIETKDNLFIIDYKLNNIDDENYKKQLNVYYKYLKKVSFKTIETYLYSIVQNKFLKVEQK